MTQIPEFPRGLRSEEDAKAFLVARRWTEKDEDGQHKAICPHCGSGHVTLMKKRGMWECRGKHAQLQFSIRTGTVFEDSRLGLRIWVHAAWLLFCNPSVSSYEVARKVAITQKSAWLVLRRIRKAGTADTFDELIDQMLRPPQAALIATKETTK